MPAWDQEVDLLVGGTGAAALAAAITGADRGLEVLVVESTDRWGGTTSISGGGLWMPTHPAMPGLGKEDSVDKALTYMEAAIGDAGPASSPARRRAFVENVPAVYTMLERLGMVWAPSKDYPDYYPDRPGGMAGGRAIESAPFDSKRLGDYWQRSRTAEVMPPIPMKTDDLWLLSRAWVTLDGFVRGAKFVFRTLGGLVTGKRLAGLGGAYAGRLMEIVRTQGTEVRLSTPITRLVVEDGAVVGAEVTGPDGVRRIRARAGVMLGTGGFARNLDWRQKHHGLEGYTSAPVGDIGTGIQLGIDVGAQTALMDDAWWGASIPMPDGREAQFLVAERSEPYSIMVDQLGKRFTNESASYIDVGHDILAHHRDVPTIPCWLIRDARHRRRYLFNPFLTGKKKFLEAGILVEADTLAELAAKMGVPAENLAATVERFNGFARTGIDEDFGRGRTAYDQYYGDPTVRPNPNLGPIEKGPFQAVKVVPGDLGTKGGLLTDEHARVLDTAGAPIPGLYAAGNATASVMGRTYPGAGSTIGPATVFGYLGAAHAATVRSSR
jgi:3-oxosteroid 1-dehydrogenase